MLELWVQYIDVAEWQRMLGFTPTALLVGRGENSVRPTNYSAGLEVESGALISQEQWPCSTLLPPTRKVALYGLS
jgi:hypothetical protein